MLVRIEISLNSKDQLIVGIIARAITDTITRKTLKR